VRDGPVGVLKATGRAPRASDASRRRGFTTTGPPHLSRIRELQRGAGNREVARLLAPTIVVSRCAKESACHCGSIDDGDLATPAAVQRESFGPLSARPALRFTSRFFVDQATPTVCPNCHREKPTVPMGGDLVDRDATEERLVSWAGESEKAIHNNAIVRVLQLDPNAVDTVVDDYGVGLVKRLKDTHEFEGADSAREMGAEMVRRRWPEVRPAVKAKLVAWYQGELLLAFGKTPHDAFAVLRPELLRKVVAGQHGGSAPLGRHGATAHAGQRYGIFFVDDIESDTIWFHLEHRPAWMYGITKADFVKHDPFVAEVARQVYDSTRWIQYVLPLVLKAGAFGVGFSGNVVAVLVSIAMSELAEEMEADAEGRPGRSLDEILGSAATQLLIDRLFHHLLGGAGGRAAAGTTRAAEQAERIAERAAPVIRAELASSEKPLVKEALETGAAHAVPGEAARAEGYTLEVAVKSQGEEHVFRLGRDGRWCRYSTPVCDLDLGADVLAAAKSPMAVTKGRLGDARALLSSIKGEMEFLPSVYDRMARAKQMDLALLTAEERALLDQLSPSGRAADLTLRELRDLPRSLGLEREFAKTLELERRLVEQLHREGRPLYETMRAASPSFAARTVVLGEASGRDAVSGLRPRSGTLHVDHVVPVSEIVRMPGFDRLRFERQLAIVNDVKNLRAMDGLANISKGDRAWSEWPQGAIYYDGGAIARMRTLEEDVRAYLEARIRTLSRP
jgi:hypothetical protein